jgi:acyl-CoA thioesterase FadM
MRVDFTLEGGGPVATGDLTLVTIDGNGRPAPVPSALRNHLVI